MSFLRGCIVLLVGCVFAGPAFSVGMTSLSAADFQRQTYRGFTLDRASSKSKVDFDDLASMGVNLVRMWVYLERCARCKAYSIAPGNLEEIDRVVSFAEATHIHVILTMAPEAPERAAFWEDSALQASIIDIWSSLAKRYKGKAAMGGFDLINEPNPPGNAKDAATQYAGFAGRLIDAVRKIDPQRMIVYEPAPRGNTFYGFGSLEHPLPYDNVLYSPHFYKPVQITHQGIKNERVGEIYPSSRWNKARLSEQMEPVREFARKYKLPIYVGEFSCVRNVPGDTTYRWIADVVELFEAEGWSWTFHSFRGFHGWDQELPPGASKPATAAAAASMRTMNTPVMTLLRSHLKKNMAPR